MVIQLGEQPWVLIGLSFLEILFIILPPFIAGKIEKKSIGEELFEIGFRKNLDPLIMNLSKIIGGIGIGILFFLLGGYIIYFFRILIIESLLGASFVQQGDEGVISAQPIQPSLIQLIVIIIFQLIIIGICEEAFFRAFIIKKFEKSVKLKYAVVLSSIFFALYHVPPFLVPNTTIITYFGYYFTFGLLLSCIFIYFDYSLIPCSIAHSIFNILVILL
ncbi:MAG: lysostaphin resistance A-like protein [Promethearchaeota archaeon]